MFSIFLTVYRLASCWTVEMVQQLYEQNICVIDQAVVRSSLLDIRQGFLRFCMDGDESKRMETQQAIPSGFVHSGNQSKLRIWFLFPFTQPAI